MFHDTFKSLKFGFWILLPLLLISNNKVEFEAKGPSTMGGSYELHATGALEQQLNGLVYFKSEQQATSQGIPFSTLTLKFDDVAPNHYHDIEFLIAKQNQSHMISKGTYEVTRNVEGLLDNFDGVFGFANIKALGEKPFFAYKGKVVITQFSNTGLQGYVDVTLKCTKGRKLYIKGSFNATRQKA